MQNSEGYWEAVVAQIRTSGTLARVGFRDADIHCWGKGANHQDLIVLSKPSWTVRPPQGGGAGYEGVNVHLESDRPGALQVHCELYPRRGSESKADPSLIHHLLQLKSQITQSLRDRIDLHGLIRFGVNVRRVSRDPCAPRSLKVMGFDIGLPTGHTPEQYVAAVEPIVAAVAGLIEEALAELRSELTSAVPDVR